MYHPFMRLCGEPSRAKYALCVFCGLLDAPFIRTYQSYSRFLRAQNHYLSVPDCFTVSFVKFRGLWKYSSISHTFCGSSADLLNSVRDKADSLVKEYLV